MMNVKEIKEILELMREHELSEVELEKDGLKLKLRKDSAGHAIVQAAAPSVPVTPIPTGGDVGGSASEASKPQVQGTQIKSPMVGTFYSSPAPDQPPFVSVGQKIKKGDVLCIVEAMKLMNEIKSEIDGTISEILVENGQAIEFDQPLFIVT